MTEPRASRRQTKQTTADRPPGVTRRCAHCSRLLPPTSTAQRRYCSARCRYRAWNEANRPHDDAPPLVPLHWHVSPAHLVTLAGAKVAGYWRGPGCPPGCPGPKDPRGWSGGVPEGREGLPPTLPPGVARSTSGIVNIDNGRPADAGLWISTIPSPCAARCRRLGDPLLRPARERPINRWN